MMYRMKMAAAAALLISAVATRAEDKPPADQPFDDTTFVKMVALCDMTEIELGKIGAAQAKSEDVKRFSEMIVKDHSKCLEELKAIAKGANIPVPDKLDEKHQQKIDKFRDYKDNDFDREFMKCMVTDHTEAVALFTRASKEAKNKEIKDFAIKTLPTLQNHLDEAKKLAK